MTMPQYDQTVQDDRLLLMLQRLLGIRTVDFHATFTEAATIIAETFGADIARRPVVMQIAELAAEWERRAVRAWARGDVETATRCQEQAAISTHRFGLLMDALADILR